MEGFCRACLVNYDQPKDLLQYTEKNRRLYVYSTGIQVKRNDAFPFQLCKDCYVKMKVSCNFKKNCRSSDKNIRNYLALKEAGDDLDFVTFMRKIQSSLAFRFPLSGHSTPAVNKAKDDDNVSTTTSIRNFMRDILQPEEIPESEVQIIRQVIEEEADVLDESLDSHWLQEDVSLDSDVQLGFSFSPFATPKHNSFNTPKANDTSQSSLPDISKLLDLESPVKNEPQHFTNETEDNQVEPTEPPVCYAERMIENVKRENDLLNLHSFNIGMRCVIDKNLDRALQCDDKSEFALDDLLATPPAGSTVSISTTSINNMLFGNKENNNQLNNKNNENLEGNDDENVGVDDEINILDDLYDDHHSDDGDKSEILEPQNIEDKYDKINFICKLCNNKKFKDDRCLSIHFIKQHKISIKNKFKKEPKKSQICVACGKAFRDRRNLARHVKSVHSEKVVPKCEKCGQIFKNEYCLKAHMQTHNIYVETKTRKHTCNICGKSYTTGYTLTLHIRGVHEKKARMTCNECGKGFQRKIDLVTHLRTHSGEKPWQCLYCDKSYARRDALSRHIKCHLEDHQDKRNKKKLKNTNDLKKHEKKLKTKKAKKLRSLVENTQETTNTGEETDDNQCLYIMPDMKYNNTEDQADTNAVKLSPNTRFFVIRPKNTGTLTYTQSPTNTSDANTEKIDDEENSNPHVEHVIEEIDNQMEIQQVENDVVANEQRQKVTETGKTDMTLEEANAFIRQIVPAADLSMPILM